MPKRERDDKGREGACKEPRLSGSVGVITFSLGEAAPSVDEPPIDSAGARLDLNDDSPERVTTLQIIGVVDGRNIVSPVHTRGAGVPGSMPVLVSVAAPVGAESDGLATPVGDESDDESDGLVAPPFSRRCLAPACAGTPNACSREDSDSDDDHNARGPRAGLV